MTKSPTDQILEAIEMAAEVHRGKPVPEKYQWMAELNTQSLSQFIADLQDKTESLLNMLFGGSAIDSIIESMDSWLTEQMESMYVNSSNPQEPEKLD